MSPGDRRSPGERDDSTADDEPADEQPTGDISDGSIQEDGSNDDEYGNNDEHESDNGHHERNEDGTRQASDTESRQHIENGGQRKTDEGRSEIGSRRGGDTSESLWTRFRTAEDGPLLLFREVLISFGIVFLLGLLLFSVSGVWPPMVAVESQSMEPNIDQYDLIFVSEPGRFAPDSADSTGVVTARSVDGSGHESFNRPGSVIVYKEPGTFGSPIIHRAHFSVEAGENWYDRANPDYISADNCEELTHCPADHAGYITKGDNEVSNGQYDQANGIAPVVKPAWVTGIAQYRLPYVGYIRLALTGAASFGPVLPAGLGAVGAGSVYAVGRREELLR